MNIEPFERMILVQVAQVFERLVNQCESLKQQLVEPKLLSLARDAIKQIRKINEEFCSNNSASADISNNFFNYVVLEQVAVVFEELVRQCNLIKQQLQNPTQMRLAEFNLVQLNQIVNSLFNKNKYASIMKKVKLERPPTFISFNHDNFSNN